MYKDQRAIRIFVADDHAIFRAGLRRLLESTMGLQVVGEACDVPEITKFLRKAKADVLLIDLKLATQAGPNALACLVANHPAVRVVVLTAEESNAQILAVFQAGARGVVPKDSASKVLIEAIRVVANGNLWVGSEPLPSRGRRGVKETDLPGRKPPRKSFGLTKREIEIVSAIVSGYSNRDIARKFLISEDTVKHHVTNVFDKVGVCNRLELALFSIHHGLVDRVGAEK